MVLRAWVRRFVLALQFLTVVQVRRTLDVAPGDSSGSMAFYPLVGGILGLLFAYGYRLFAWVWPPFMADFLVVGFMVVCTRALHLDGLADTLDGLLGARDPTRSLEIMKDSRVGSFGVVGIVLVLLWKWTALTGLPGDIKFRVLLCVPVVSRYSVVQMSLFLPYARPAGGLGKPFVDELTWKELLAAAALAAAIGFWASGVLGLVLLALMCVLAAVESLVVRRRLGGVTGDVLGAVLEVNEAVALSFVMALVFRV